MKKTILKIVQDCLAEMGSDNVNSIDDTIESRRVATILEKVYYDIISHRTIPLHKKLITLDASGDNTKPNYLKLPEEIQEMMWVRYNRIKSGETRDRWKTIKYLYPDEFIRHINNRNNTETNVDVITDWDGTELLIRNDLAPEYWTSFDDEYLVFDSYDSAVDTTLQSSKSQAYARVEPTITMTDDFVVDLPTEEFSLLQAALDNRAFAAIPQRDMPLLKQEEERQRRRMSRKSWQAAGGVRLPNYGRYPRKYLSPNARATFNQDRD